ncbi:hypothetical protein DACRYDRAFT_90214 [Dacryopinax primogenitus]|uniref:RTA1-domain-containing protein n=1 Tax=Dacryopinax primogenitus (strain DJM 731) TaxID=1858805 RepID=M5G745_DACPD|nr:uncharacterized protein DACRYDRAFT_90214 [Dacryopinax primogenitus]EJT99582.1 hypothetical protein DACRYDRAFT_90214 [Dacryopinax primogenitus]
MTMDQHCLPPTDPNAAYLYCASFTAAIAFTVLYGLTTIVHFGEAIAYRKRFCWVIIMGSVWELVGLIFRTLTTMNQSQTTFVSISAPFILLAPIWINAFVYMCLGRMMHYFLPGERIFGIKAETIAVIFIWGDITSFLVQAGGGLPADSATDPNVIRICLLVYTGGVALQQLFILFFFAIAIRFHMRLSLLKRARGMKGFETVLMWTLYVVLVLITIRIIYRILEFSMGYINYVTTHEVFYFVFDALPMFLALVIFNIWHPAKILVGEDSDFGNGCSGSNLLLAPRNRKSQHPGTYLPYFLLPIAFLYIGDMVSSSSQ